MGNISGKNVHSKHSFFSHCISSSLSWSLFRILLVWEIWQVVPCCSKNQYPEGEGYSNSRHSLFEFEPVTQNCQAQQNWNSSFAAFLWQVTILLLDTKWDYLPHLQLLLHFRKEFLFRDLFICHSNFVNCALSMMPISFSKNARSPQFSTAEHIF